MLKKNRSINILIEDIFYWNTHLGNLILAALVSAITIWFLSSDQKTGCTVALSIYNQYSNSISRELELENTSVAKANFEAFVKDLSSLGISNNLFLNVTSALDNAVKSEVGCSINILSAKLNIPLSFASKINGTISGSISYFPSLLALFTVWIVTLFLITTLKRIESGVKSKLDKELITPIRTLSLGNILEANSKYADEVNDINLNIISLKEKIISTEKMENEILRSQQMNLLTAQVSHDIRSPLSALNMILGQLDTLPEQSRVLVRSSVNRISDIANSLLNHNKNQTSGKSLVGTQLENTMLASLIESLVSEKRTAMRDSANIQLEAFLDKSYGLFSKISPMEMKRLLSNAITNAAEAFDNNQGTIEVILSSVEDKVILTIKDNGKGISPHILEKLGAQGITHGKDGTQSGSGLGVYHAKKTIEGFGGKYEMQSTVGIGTSIVITLKKETPPDWFVQKLLVKKGQTVVATDDDSSILEIWKQRLAGFIDASDVNLITCTSGTCLRDWMVKHPDSGKDAICLMDYELLGQKQTGLDLIEELGLNKRDILVSSRYEEAPIKERCAKLGVKLIPKGMASLVPIELEKEKQKLDAILIDDDTELINRPIETNSSPMKISEEKIRYDLCLIDDDQALIGAMWGMVAASKGLKIRLFATPQAFVAEADKIDPQTPIYIDVSLGNGVSGLDVAHDIHKMGFTEINLATGYQADSMKVPPFISSVVGKDFPNVGYAGATTS